MDPCQIIPYVSNVASASAKWAWNENSGTSYLYNAQNGSGYRLDYTDTGGIALGLTPGRLEPFDDSQRWPISSIADIDDESYSTVCFSLFIRIQLS